MDTLSGEITAFAQGFAVKGSKFFPFRVGPFAGKMLKS